MPSAQAAQVSVRLVLAEVANQPEAQSQLVEPVVASETAWGSSAAQRRQASSDGAGEKAPFSHAEHEAPARPNPAAHTQSAPTSSRSDGQVQSSSELLPCCTVVEPDGH